MGRDQARCLPVRFLIPPVENRACSFHRTRLNTCSPSRCFVAPPSVPSHFSSIHGAFTMDSLRVRWIPLLQSFYRLGSFAMGTTPRVHSFPVFRLLCPFRLSPRASRCREAFPPHYFPTALDIPQGVCRVHSRGLQHDGGGGAFLVAPSALCGSPALS